MKSVIFQIKCPIFLMQLNEMMANLGIEIEFLNGIKRSA